MPSGEGKYTLGANRGPLAPEGTDGSPKLDQFESAGDMLLGKSLTRREKARRHCKRFRFCYLLGTVVFLAIFLPILFLVVIPAIAQRVVNNSDLLLVNAAVTQPKPDSVKLALQVKINLKISLPVRIEPIKLDLFERKYGPDDAYGAVTIPGQTMKGNYSMKVTDQVMPLLNMTAWQAFIRQVVFEKETAISVKGATNAYLGVLKSHVTMNKDVVSTSLNQFAGFSISGSTLVLPSETDGTNLVGNATLPNPTVFTLQVGTLVLDIKSGDLVVGNATLTDVELKPGTNTFPLKGVLDINTVLANLPEILRSQGSALGNGYLIVSAVTKSVMWNGTLVPYYTDVLHHLTLTANISVGDTVRNTIRQLLSPSGNGISSRGLLDSSVSSNSSDTSSLAASLKQNKYVRDIVRDEHSVR